MILLNLYRTQGRASTRSSFKELLNILESFPMHATDEPQSAFKTTPFMGWKMSHEGEKWTISDCISSSSIWCNRLFIPSWHFSRVHLAARAPTTLNGYGYSIRHNKSEYNLTRPPWGLSTEHTIHEVLYTIITHFSNPITDLENIWNSIYHVWQQTHLSIRPH